MTYGGAAEVARDPHRSIRRTPRNLRCAAISMALRGRFGRIAGSVSGERPRRTGCRGARLIPKSSTASRDYIGIRPTQDGRSRQARFAVEIPHRGWVAINYEFVMNLYTVLSGPRAREAGCKMASVFYQTTNRFDSRYSRMGLRMGRLQKPGFVVRSRRRLRGGIIFVLILVLTLLPSSDCPSKKVFENIVA